MIYDLTYIKDLVIYLAAAKEAISAVLMTKRDGKQVPIYFVSQALQGPEVNYTPMEKLILALWSVRRMAHRMDIIHRRIIMCRWLWGRFNNHESGRDGVRLCSKQIPRGENKKADALSKIASTSFAHLSKQVLLEKLREKAIDEKEVLAVVEEEGHTWMTTVYEYLTEGVLPEEKKKARMVRRMVGRYAVISEVLYKKDFLGPWLRCVGPLQANYVLREIHEGSCNMHAGPRSVVAKALRLGYFWPTMHTDAKNLIRKCKDC
nr:reverse transcriptase domain-containing protein [Tanacetum cinerariifolium]